MAHTEGAAPVVESLEGLSLADVSLGETPLAPAEAAGPSAQRESLEALATLSLRVKNGRNPLAGVEVKAMEASGTTRGGTVERTDRRGRARINVPAHSSIELQLALPGAIELIRQGVLSPGPGEIKPVVVDASRHASGLTVTVQLVSFPTGAPIAGSKVTALEGEESSLDRALTRSTDSDGRVTLPWVPDGRYVGSAPRHGSMEIAAPETGSNEPLTLELPEDAMLFGQVELRPSASGKVPKLAISAGLTDETGSMAYPTNIQDEITPLLLDEVPEVRGPGWRRTRLGGGWAEVDRRGNWQIVRVRFSDLRPLTGAKVHAFIDHRWRTLATGLTVRPGERLEVPDLSEGQPDLVLHLSLDRGYPWSRFHAVTLCDASQPDGSVFVRSYCTKDGTVRVPRLPRGTWDLFLAAPKALGEGQRLARFDHADSAPKNIVLEGWVPLRGTVDPPRPEGHGGVDIVLLQRGHRVDTCQVKEGRFDLSPVPMDTLQTLSLRESSERFIHLDFGSMELDQDDGGLWAVPALGEVEHKAQYLATGEDVVVKR